VNVFIEIVSGPEKGRTLQLSDNQLLRVGRSKKADAVFALDKSISSLHFSLECAEQICRIKDLNSRNGTFLNGRRVTEAVLKTGDEILAGHTTCVVSIHDTSLSASSSVRTGASVEESISSDQTIALTITPTVPVATLDQMDVSAAVTKETKPSRVARSPRRFYVELYEEHLEEASFLYAQRLTLLDDLEVSWITVGEWDERLEAHIDALVVGEDLALEVCAQHAAEGDFGELFAAVCVFCRQQRFDLLQKVLAALDLEDPEKLQAMADALKYECPAEWQPELLRVLPADDPRMRFLQATFCGYRRMREAREWSTITEGDPPAVIGRVAWACGRIGSGGEKTLLRQAMAHEDGAVRSAAILALLRLGDHQFVLESLGTVSDRPIPWPTVAVGESRTLVNLLLSRVARSTPTPDELLALGILGDVAAVPVLLAHLPQEELAPAAALGLNVMTGAELYEKAFIPEVMDEDELFEDEKEQVKKGQPVLRPDGKPYGENVVRLSQKAEDWQQWWSANKQRFKAGLRYRSGAPFSPGPLVENMAFEKTPRKIRQLAYEELVIRYGADIPFEADMPVTQQQAAIAKWKSWVTANEGRFKPGEWYLGGQLLSTPGQR
jgi:uncharacterized protein (TIGR02270 family)